MTFLILLKCAEIDERFPSAFACDCVWQCLRLMDSPSRANEPLATVQRYYTAIGRENEIMPPRKVADALDPLLLELDAKSRAERAKAAAQRLKEFHRGLSRSKEPLPKHLHLKISEGMNHLPQRIKEKALWLRVSPNALVVSCVRDCIQAMDDPKKAVVPPPTVVDFWTISHAKSRHEPSDAINAMILKSSEGTLRRRGGPILDTVIRLALLHKWDATLEQILREADAITEEREIIP
jgi:hypothetical protein